MKSHSIELIVDEPIPGHYCWVLLKHESPDQNPVPVDYAAGPMPTYTAAMKEGIAALERRAESRAASNGPNTLH
ncbi:hypothetical protein WKW79_11575 [Variovorax robiniae]|uniref:Uncharacterized protein n=1 Tax=Variovorax robiniae TaxID=1836199 RepID=A0ABU8X7Z3_9BURK